MLRPAAMTLPAIACFLLAGCGAARQTSGEGARDFQVRIVRASFPAKQQIASPTTLSITVENIGERALPDVAVTVDSLSYRASRPKGLADPERPTWIVNTGPGPLNHPPVESEEVMQPGGGQTAFVHTWALGRLQPHALAVFRWQLTPVLAGTHTVRFAVAAGLNGEVKALLRNGRRPIGSFTVDVAPQPRGTHVDPRTGAVVPGANPVSSGPVGAVP